MMKLRYYFPGSVIILLGILMIAFPEILVALVALFLIMLGLGALSLGHLIRKSEAELTDFNSDFSNKGSHRRWVGRVPLWRTRFRKPRSFH